MKLVIITGINRGLGEAFFNHLINDKDVFIVGVSRRITERQQVLLKNEKFALIKFNLTNLVDPSKDLNLVEYFKKADEVIYINNAATIHPINKIGGFKNREIMDLINLNTRAPILITNYLLKEASNKRIAILNISSGAAWSAIVGWSLYCASKAANEMFFNTLELQETENKNLKVLNIDPGVIDSGLQEIIRNTNSKVFPRVSDFIQLKKDNKLVTAKEAAAKIILNSNFFRKHL